MGYARSVDEHEGLSYRQFIALLKELQRFSMGLAAQEQGEAHDKIKELAQRGMEAAGAYGKRTVYGPSPADRHLHAWLSAEESVVIDLKDLVKMVREHAEYRRKTQNIFSEKPKAAMLPGYGGTATTSKSETKKVSKQKAKGKTTSPSPSSKAKAEAKGDKGKSTAKKKGNVYPYNDGTFSIGEPSPLCRLPCDTPHAASAMREMVSEVMGDVHGKPTTTSRQGL